MVMNVIVSSWWGNDYGIPTIFTDDDYAKASSNPCLTNNQSV